MPTTIKLVVNDITLQGELADTPCARAIADALPIETKPHEWGDEFYFEIPVVMELDRTATTVVNIGDIGYWPPGKALAVFFGPTPISPGTDPVPASDVNLVGRISGDATILRQAAGAEKIRIEKE